MMKEYRLHNIQTHDQKSIYYSVNFNPVELDPHETVLIFNYGLVCSKQHWSRQIPFFDAKGFKILLHDYRGHYQSEGSDEIHNCHFKNFVADLRLILDEVKIQKAIMLGHSMGVNVSLEFAKDFPQLLQGMVLISGTVVPPKNTIFDSSIMELITPLAQKMQKSFPKLFQYFWQKQKASPLVQQFMLYSGFNAQHVPLSFIQEYLENIGKLHPALFFQLFSEMNQHDIKNYLPQISIPTLLISGEKDLVIPNYYQYCMLEALPQAELYILKDGSHVPQVDFPDLVNERILLFIEKLKTTFSI